MQAFCSNPATQIPFRVQRHGPIPTIINKKPYRLLILSKRAVFADTLARWVTPPPPPPHVTAVQTPYYRPAL
ncbi:hypothetical protein K6U28_19330 [Vibrio parahaemolyticus]|nr:hypothetical protein [Vibrio parahaemolyticus]